MRPFVYAMPRWVSEWVHESVCKLNFYLNLLTMVNDVPATAEKKRKRRKRKSSNKHRPHDEESEGSKRVVEPEMPQKDDYSTDAVAPTSAKKLKAAPEAVPTHPFEVDETDHCETPLEAYTDAIQLLDFIAKSLGKKRDTIRIYDPYFCDGGIKVKLASLGFANVINENQDFYDNIENNTIPPHDVLVTNPPYSGHHMEKLLSFCSTNRKPFLLLLPHFVYTKDYYKRGLGETLSNQVFYICPLTRYSYIPPAWVSVNGGSAALKKGKTQTAPFPSFWYCRIPAMSDAWLSKTFGASGKFDVTQRLHYAKCTAHIPRECKGEFDDTKKRPNPRARKRSAAKKRKGY